MVTTDGHCRRLENRVALVTGSAGGIGRGIAERLYAEGATVVIHDLDQSACETTAAELGDRAAAIAGDVTDPDSADRVVAQIVGDHGGLDILVNNAGVTRDGSVHRIADGDWELVHKVVLYGAFAMCRAAAPALRAPADHHRKVVMVSSNVALHGAPGTATYSAAKAGVIGLTKTLAREWAPRRVNVNAIAPGVVDGGGMTSEKPQELIARVIEQVPLGRAGTLADVGAAVAFLASPDSDYVTGQVLELSGGLEVPV